MVKRRSIKRTKQNNKTLRRNNKSKRRTNKRYKKKMRGGMEAAAAASSQTPDPPKPFICPISREIMDDPVIDPEGNTYERSSIKKWLRVKEESPITRKPLTSDQLVVNRALKDTIDLYNSIKLQMVNPDSEMGNLVGEEVEPAPAPAEQRAEAAPQVVGEPEDILERLSPYNQHTYQFWSNGDDRKMVLSVHPYMTDRGIRRTVPLWGNDGEWIRDIEENESFILHTGPENISIKDLHARSGDRRDCVCAKVDLINSSSGATDPSVSSGWFNLYDIEHMLGARKRG